MIRESGSGESQENKENKTVYILGAGGHAKVVIRTLQELGYTVAAAFDDAPGKIGTSLLGVPVAGTLAEAAKLGPVAAINAIGDNGVRRTTADQLRLDWITAVHPGALVDRTVQIGRGCVVLAGAVVQPDAVLGEHVIVNTGATVDHDCRVGNYAHLAPGVHLAGEVSVGEGALLGVGAVANPGVTIGAWSVVGAGATVVRNVPGHVVAVGVPARPVREIQRINGKVVRSELVGLPERLPESADPPLTNPEEGVPERNKRIYLSAPHMSEHERAMLLDAFHSNWIAPLGPHVDAFEREFAEKLGVPHAVAVSSGTAALHLALLLVGVEPGDEVATSTLTFAASANAIRYVGAEPVFVDSEPGSWNLDPQLLAEVLKSAVQRGRPVKAVLAVDVCGQCADYQSIQRLCRFYDVPLIEDAAEALGATYRGRPAGSFGDIGCFSFNGNKIITTGGGGILVTQRKDWADRARFLATQARDPAPHYEHSELGYNYRLSNLLAAVGRGQLRVLDDRVRRRRKNFRFYQQALADLPGIEFMPEPFECRSTHWLTCILVDADEFGAAPESVRLALERENIEARPLWKPMHRQPLYAACRAAGGAVAERLFRDGLCLPSGSNLSPADLARITDVIRSVFCCPDGCPCASG